MKTTWLHLLVVAIALSLSDVYASDVESFNEGEKLFALHVKPLLAEKCLACHGANPDEIEGGLDLRSREGLLAGGDSFEQDVLITGDGQHSMLYITTTREEGGYEMPPKEADQLSEEQQWWIRDWIDAGAAWPDHERVRQIQQAHSDGEQVLVSRALSDQWQNRRYEAGKLWAYRPIRKPPVPKQQHPVDWFIDQKLEKVGLAPAPPGDANTLIRRISFGLTGLPPSPTDVDTFASAYQSDPDAAVEALAGKLMAS